MEETRKPFASQRTLSDVCAGVCLCGCACTCACVLVCVHMCARVCVQFVCMCMYVVCVCACTHVPMCGCARARARVCVWFECVCMHVCMRVCVCARVHVHMRVRAYTWQETPLSWVGVDLRMLPGLGVVVPTSSGPDHVDSLWKFLTMC